MKHKHRIGENICKCTPDEELVSKIYKELLPSAIGKQPDVKIGKRAQTPDQRPYTDGIWKDAEHNWLVGISDQNELGLYIYWNGKNIQNNKTKPLTILIAGEEAEKK